jgi:hypothetical protein
VDVGVDVAGLAGVGVRVGVSVDVGVVVEFTLGVGVGVASGWSDAVGVSSDVGVVVAGSSPSRNMSVQPAEPVPTPSTKPAFSTDRRPHPCPFSSSFIARHLERDTRHRFYQSDSPDGLDRLVPFHA